MKYRVLNHQTNEEIGKLSELDYSELEKLLISKFEAIAIVFAHMDPLPGIVSVNVIMAETNFYERINVVERDLKQEAMDLILSNVPFDWGSIQDVGDHIVTKDGKKHYCNWN